MIRVLVVEDSLVQRSHLVRTLEAEGDIEVVGQAERASEVMDLVRALGPDVVTLDLQLPDGAGSQVIEQVMAFEPTPILVLSARVTSRESHAAVEALVAGAVDAFPKPVRWDAEAERSLREQVRVIQGVTVVRHLRGSRAARRRRDQPTPPVTQGTPIVAIAASTGGPAAFAEILGRLGGLAAAVLVVQHIHAEFVAGFVEWMTRVSALPTELATDGRRVRPGTVYIAPGDVHLTLGAGNRIALLAEPETMHRPSADVLFSSIAARVRGPKVGVVLTGMGDDGAQGLLELRRAGAITIAQDEASSAVYGMPAAARLNGAATRVAPLGRMARAIDRAVRELVPDADLGGPS